MGDAAQDPQSRFVHASDNDLPVGEFEEARRVTIEHRGDHALRREQDRKSGLAQRPRERKIVAHRTVPEFHHVALLEAFAANRRAASPAEISVMLAEIRRGGRIPGRRQRAPESADLREKPAKRRHRAEVGIRQRRHEPREPASAGTPVGIRKNVNVEPLRGLQNRRAKVIHFLSAIVRPPGNHDVNFVLAGRGDALDDFTRRIIGARHREENLVIGIIKGCQRRNVLFEPRLGALHRAK